jgi:hypothetical protein
LKEDLKTLKEIIPKPGEKIMMMLSAKTEIELEYEQMQSEPKIDDSAIQDSIATLKEFLGMTDVSDEVIGLALKKCNLDMEGAINIITCEDLVQDLEIELAN